MSTATLERTAPVARAERRVEPIPMTRIVAVELSKMFNTRSGFWLMASIGIAAVIATAATILFAPDAEVTQESFSAAIGFPMAIILPMVAILSVTSEWSQRSGLTTFTLVPHRGRVIGAKLAATLAIGIVSMVLALVIGAAGTVLGSALAGLDPVWDVTVADFVLILLANVLGMLVGFTLGILIRNSPGAIVGYFIYSLVLPGALAALAAFQTWFVDLQGWVDFNFASSRLFEGSMAGTDWAQLGVSSIGWLLIPLAVGLRLVVRSEVK